MEALQKWKDEELTRFFYNRTHFFDFLAHFKGFFDFFFIFESDYKKIVLTPVSNFATFEGPRCFMYCNASGSGSEGVQP